MRTSDILFSILRRLKGVLPEKYVKARLADDILTSATSDVSVPSRAGVNL